MPCTLYTLTTENYLRGVQETNAAGEVTFTTIFPGCYSGRMPHKVFSDGVTQQLATVSGSAATASWPSSTSRFDGFSACTTLRLSMKPWQRWSILTCLVLALILVPFALWEDAISAWTARLLAPAAGRATLAVLVVFLLASDVLLPIPSSFVSAGAVSLLGAWQGGITIFIGMTCAAWLGYALGRFGGEPLVARLAGPSELSRASRMMDRYGSWVLLVCRGVPVVAEASTLLAGATRVAAWRFALVTGLGNLGLSCAYALIGILLLSGGWALAAPFAFGIAVPALALLLMRPLASN